MPFWLEIIIAACLVLGGFFGLVGSLGLLKLSDAMARLHAPTKATTLGVGGVLLASIANVWALEGRLSLHEVLVMLFLYLTAPVSAHFIAKAHIHRRTKPEDLPPTATDRPWASFESDADREAIEEEGAPAARVE